MRKITGLLLFVLLITICWASVTTNIGINLTISGLGNSTISYSKSFSATEPNAVAQQYRVLDTNNVSEAIDFGDVSTVTGMMLACIDDSNDATTGGLYVDCNYVSSFSTDIHIAEGEAAYFKPAGTVRVIGSPTEKPIYEFIVFGTR